jgi:hypothetical protein
MSSGGDIHRSSAARLPWDAGAARYICFTELSVPRSVTLYEIKAAFFLYAAMDKHSKGGTHVETIAKVFQHAGGS